jgi:PhnB protein
MTDPVPAGYPMLSPYLSVDGAAAAMDFYCDVFGFSRRGDVMTAPDGRIGHAELVLGSSLLMLADEWPEAHSLSPATIGGSPVMLSIYVADVDAVYAAALAAGATGVREPEDEFYGDRMGAIVDPWGPPLEHRLPHRRRRPRGDGPPGRRRHGRLTRSADRRCSPSPPTSPTSPTGSSRSEASPRPSLSPCPPRTRPPSPCPT